MNAGPVDADCNKICSCLIFMFLTQNQIRKSCNAHDIVYECFYNLYLTYLMKVLYTGTHPQMNMINIKFVVLQKIKNIKY